MFLCVPAMENPDEKMPVLVAPDERRKIRKGCQHSGASLGGGTVPPLSYTRRFVESRCRSRDAMCRSRKSRCTLHIRGRERKARGVNRAHPSRLLEARL